MHASRSLPSCVQVAVLAGGLVASRMAFAADSEHDQAQVLLHQGAEGYASGNFGEALVDFHSAYERVQSPRILYDIAQCHLKLGHDLQAALAFQKFLAATFDDPKLPNRDGAKTALESLEAHLARLELEIEPDTALGLVDGSPSSPGVMFLKPGKHVVSVSATGFIGETQNLSIKAGEDSRVTIHLKPEVDAKSLPK